jgi:Mrp family chromosome partitioning ATPase
MYVLYKGGDQSGKSILVTSSILGEGKTFMAINLAINLAMSGKKVVLVGIDLRKPKI